MVEKLAAPKALVLAAPGINRDLATQRAFELAGTEAEVVHLTQLKTGEKSLEDYQIFSIPGGFSFGDHIQSGRVLALEFMFNNLLTDQILEHLRKGRLILGVCNGFQVLMQTGLLPFGQIQTLEQNVASLTNNQPDRFQSRWIFLETLPSRCLIAEADQLITLPIAHGEGRFVTSDEVYSRLIDDRQIVYRYSESQENPNGSRGRIAGICDPSGQILGMMPHAEDFVRRQQHPNWRRLSEVSVDGLRFFEKIVKVAREL